MSLHNSSDDTIRYRSDIDGIRAIAVSSVLLYHFFPQIIPGGFIGVDVFFVISGYLITSIILYKNKKQSLSILDFYARRIKRIFPALSITLISCLAFGWFALLSDEYRQLGKHVAASTIFVQNLTLLSEANYFDNASIAKPLLHLWSLGIEEQFYLIWPLIIYLCIKYNKSLGVTLLLAGSVSFLIDLWYLKSGHPSAAYYSPDSRAWELLAGAMLAWLHNQVGYIRQKNIFDEIIVLASLTLLALGLFFIDQEKNFPGFYALIPTAATCMLIFAHPENRISKKLLSSRMMVFIGLISYPLYLWHWPLLSYAWILSGSEPSISLKFILIAATFILSLLTYYFIEKPFRNKTYSWRSVVGLASVLLVTGSSGAIVYLNNGFPQRQNAELQGYPGDIGHDQFHKFIATKYVICTPSDIAATALRWGNYIRCMQSKEGNDIDIVLLGDSHAEHLFIGMAESLPNKNIAFYIEDGSPFPGNNKFTRLYEAILKNKHIKTVVLTMYWHGRVGEVPQGSSLEEQIAKTARIFTSAGKKVILTDDVPDFPFTPDKCKGRRWLSIGERTCTISQSESDKEKNSYISALERVAEKNENVTLLSERKYLCDGVGCSMIKDGKLMYRDMHHLNINGSRYIGKELVINNPQAFN
ncbi:hypothetical protein VW41_14590 [Klebsiella michiganensis]|nr:hypothetical protein VW41_14590 [Klebsiella michiganensis]